MRRISLAGIALSFACAGTACFAPVAPPPDAAGEDEIRFRGAQVDPTLPDVDAQGYELDIRVDDAAGREAFSADMKGTYVATKNLDELVLDFEGNTVDDVLVSGRPTTHRREGTKLFIKLPSTIQNGKTFTTRVRYHGNVLQADGANPNDFAAFGGLNVKQRNAERKRIFSSLNWPSKAKKWLPTRDHPADGAMFAVNATFPKAFTVLANGKQVNVVDNTDGTKTWRYEALTPMPVYDFHISAYEGWKVDEAKSSTNNVPIATYTYANAHARQGAIYGDVPKSMDFYEKSFGKFRWGSIAFIEEPIFGGGMEHAGVISMDETLFPDPKTARATAFHELAHHWSGNLARIRTWNDFWLSEGFTEYLTARFIAANDGPAAKKTVYREYLTQALEVDRTTPHALRPADPEIDVLTIFDAISYQKGALTLRAIERIVGEKELTEFLKGWFDRHAFQAVTTSQLVSELKEKTGKDLTKFFDGFVYAQGHPEIRVTFDAAGADTEIKVEQIQTKGPAGGYVFPLDIDLVDESGRAERFTVDLTGKTTTKKVRPAKAPVSVVVDADEYLVGTIACGQSNANAPCKEGFRCQGGAVSVCVPK